MKKRINIILLICVFFINNINAQVTGTPYILYEIPSKQEICTDVSTKGTDFWVTFGKNFTRNTHTLILMLLKIATEDEITDVTLNFTETGETTTIYNIAAHSLYTVDLSSVPSLGDRRDALYLNKSGITSGTSFKSLHITSTKPISVYAFNTSSSTTDATSLLPTESWGREYYRLSSAPYDDVCYDIELIIAKESTTLTLPDNSTQSLYPGQIYYNSLNADMTGRHIISDKPIAYFTHTNLSAVPAGRTYGDIIFEQLMSVDRWGKQFLVPNAIQRGININGIEINNSMNNIVRIVASENSTKINFSGATHFGGQNIVSGGTINAGQYVELLLISSDGACYIDADKPIGVCAYLVGDGASSSSSDYIGDPSIAWVPAINQTVELTVIAPFYPGNSPNGGSTRLNHPASKHYATIITKTATKTQTKIDGINIFYGWKDNIESGYSYYVKQFDNNADINSSFKIENPNGIIVLCHGTSNVESYYYNAGSGACVIN